jgi:hypothetical protein
MLKKFLVAQRPLASEERLGSMEFAASYNADILTSRGPQTEVIRWDTIHVDP